MTLQFPDYLRLHTEDHCDASDALRISPLALLQQSFAELTGWSIEIEKSGRPTTAARPASVDSSFSIRIVNGPTNVVVDSPTSHVVERPAVERFVTVLNGVLSLLAQTNNALRKREAELAAGVPVVLKDDDEKHLADRLEAVLKGGAEALGCQAAGLYLLDDATTELKLRACWGIPHERLLEPARPLRNSFADLEAMLGHAVVLEDTQLLPNWHSPEDFPSAVCVPLSSASTILGTLWFFCDRTRDFSAKQTNLAEIIAGRIVADLEREILVAQTLQNAGHVLHNSSSKVHCEQPVQDPLPRNELLVAESGRASEAISSADTSRAPVIMPTKRRSETKLIPWLVDGWEIAGFADRPENSCNFLDWCILPDGTPAFTLASADGYGMERLHTSTMLYGAIKSHNNYPHNCRQMLSRLNETMWTGSAGDQLSSLFYARLDQLADRIAYSAVGDVLALLVQRNRTRRLPIDIPLIGSGPDAVFRERKFQMLTGDVLILVAGKILGNLDQQARTMHMSRLGKSVRRRSHLNIDTLLSVVCDYLERVADVRQTRETADLVQDFATLILKRTPVHCGTP